MNYKNIDLENYPRKSHFEYFKSLAYPYVGVTVNVDITDWFSTIKQQGYPFFLSFLYAITKAANAVPEFRQRIEGDGIIEFDECLSSYTVSTGNETYCYCNVECNLPLHEFLTYAKREQEKAIEHSGIDDGEAVQSFYFISSLPWLTYSNIIQPVPIPADSNPRITWGKYYEASGKILIPVSVLCHHALIDGVHIGKFYDYLQNN